MEAKNLICLRCKHLRPSSGGCDAFPGDIPDEITSGENPHSSPLPDQANDIVFEEGPVAPWEVDGPTPEELEELRR